MSKRLTLEIQQERAALKGGKCLSTEFINNRTKMEWQCDKGHTWWAMGNKIQQGKWCPHCAGRCKDISYVRSVAAKFGGKVLDTEYKTTKHKYQWQCKKGHTWKSKLSNVIHLNRWCPHCSGNARCSIEDMHKVAKNRGWKCLSTEYNGTHGMIEWQCGYGHVWKSPPRNIKHGWGCPYCAHRAPITIDRAHAVAKSRNGKCLSSHVPGNSAHLEWQCKKGHIWKASFANVNDKGSWCPQCREWSTEEKCREIFERLFKQPFPKKKNIFGSRLELDGYCEPLNLAFEYNGEQHYKVCKWFKMTAAKLKIQQGRDLLKARLCRDNGINLVVVPYTAAKNGKLEEYIEKEMNIVHMQHSHISTRARV